MVIENARQFVGKRGTLESGGIVVKVNVIDVKIVFGRLMFFIEPVAGTGSKWVNADSVTLEIG